MQHKLGNSKKQSRYITVAIYMYVHVHVHITFGGEQINSLMAYWVLIYTPHICNAIRTANIIPVGTALQTVAFILVTVLMLLTRTYTCT